MVARSGNASAIWVYTAGRALSTAYISTPSMIVPFQYAALVSFIVSSAVRYGNPVDSFVQF